MGTVTVIHSAYEENPQEVAKVDVGSRKGNEALQHAFFRTKNIQDSWSLKGDVDGSDEVDVVGEFPMHDGQKLGIRSTAVGDRLEVDGVAFYVDMFGFTDTETDYIKAQRRAWVTAMKERNERS